MGAKTSSREVVKSEAGCSEGNKVAAARLAVKKLVVPAGGPEMISRGGDERMAAVGSEDTRDTASGSHEL